VTDQKKSNIPENWSRTRLADISEIIRGVTYKKAQASESPMEGHLPILRATNIQENHLVLDKDLIFIPQNLVTEKQHLREGDIVVATSSGSKHLVGKTAQVKKSWAGSFGAFCAAIRPSPVIDHHYLGYFFESREYKDFIAKQALGVNINNLRRGDLEEISVPIAPFGQQKLIVAEIEKQFSRLDEAVANLKRVKANLKRYKAAVLKAAVEGKLTEDLPCRQAGWRDPSFRNISDKRVPEKSSAYFAYVLECDDGTLYKGFSQDLYARINLHLAGRASKWTKEHKPVALIHFEEFPSEKEAVEREKYFKTGSGRKWINELRNQQKKKHEPASKLLERILAERRKKWEEAELAKMKAKGKVPEDDKWKKKYTEPILPNSEVFHEIPNGWIFASLDQLCPLFVDSPHRTPKYSDAGHPAIRPRDVVNGILDLDKAAVVNDSEFEVQTARHIPQTGDIIYSRELSFGWGAEIPDNASVCLSQGMCLFRPFVEVSSKYFLYLLNGPTGRKQAEKAATGSAHPHINLGDIKSYAFPVAPIKEQVVIVGKLDENISTLNELEKYADSQLKRAERLRQSILVKAFSGQLISKNEIFRSFNMREIG